MRTLAELAALRTGACRASAGAVPALAAGDATPDRHRRAHVEQCLRCQAEIAAFRRVLRTMATMRDEPVAAALAPGSPGAGQAGTGPARTGDGPDSAGGVSPWAVRAVCVGSLTASAAGVLVWISRRRPLEWAG